MLVVNVKGSINISDMDKTIGKLFETFRRIHHYSWDNGDHRALRLFLANTAMSMASIFAKATSPFAAFLFAATFALTDDPMTSAGGTNRLALFAATAAWVFHIIIHNSIISLGEPPTKKCPGVGKGHF